WLSELENKPEKVFLVHGENEALEELGTKIKEKFGFDCVIPQINQQFEL
ncbi:MBL fold metallo-hydrolase, partial [bacterium]|nr:MBL fold metallo-hydrolase [bacterium]